MKFFNRKPKGLIVFVKNKLISIDSIAPILLELKENHNISSTVVVFDQLAHEAIKANVVLRDLTNFVGRELFVSQDRNKVVRIFSIFVSMLGLLFKLIIGHKIVHFGALNAFPLRYIFFFNRKNIFFSQQDSFRHSWTKYNQILGHLINSKVTPTIGNNIIAFNDMMDGLNEFNRSKNVFFFGETRTRKIWLDYCINNSKYYLNKYHADIDFSRGCIVFILTTFEGLDGRYINSKTGILKLFYETIEILSSFNIPILLKPHVHTDLDIVNKAIINNKNMHVTFIHPTILALKSKCFIANLNSTTFADAHSLGVPTIEYTDYPIHVLEATNKKSLSYEYVDNFINNDQVLLKESIKNALIKPQVPRIVGHANDDSGLLKKLSE